jgi:hypothetical protein
MHHNVGSDERTARLIVAGVAGVAGLAAARRKTKVALAAVALPALITGLISYCPFKAALTGPIKSALTGCATATRNTLSRHDASVRNTEIRRETQTSGAMGRLAGTTVSPLETHG